MMNNDELLSKTISYLRFPLIVGVVFTHFNLVERGLSLHGVEYGINNPDWLCWIVNFFSKVISKIGMRLFFIISGFLFFYRKDFNDQVYKQKLRTRAKTLLIPYFLWNIIAILIPLFHKLPFLSWIFPYASKTEIHLSLGRLFHTFFDNTINEGIYVYPIIDTSLEQTLTPYPIDYPLWYLRDLFVIILFSPAIYWLIKKCKIWFVVALGLLWFVHTPLIAPQGGWSKLLVIAAFFFSWGAYYSINKVNFVEVFRKYRFAPYVYMPVALADAVSKKADYNLYIHNFGIILGIISAVIVVSYLVEKRKAKMNEILTNSTFFIFALHTLIIDDIGKMVITILRISDSTYGMLALYFITPLLTIAVCIALNMLLRSYMPRISRLLTGGR